MPVASAPPPCPLSRLPRFLTARRPPPQLRPPGSPPRVRPLLQRARTREKERERERRAAFAMALFEPFRALGYVSTHVPFALQSRGQDHFVTTVVGNAYHVYNVRGRGEHWERRRGGERREE